MMAISKTRSPLLNWKGEYPIESLVFYRITFGILILFSTLRFIYNGWVNDFYIQPDFHFSYYGFEWLPYPSPIVIYFLFALMICGSIGIILGLFYRISAVVFFLAFTYVELLDKTYYLNHYYFVSLIALILIFLPANKGYSLDVKWRKKSRLKMVPNWTVAIIMFQITVVYVFAGIAKINSDWLLQAQPLKIWLHSAGEWPLVGSLLTQDWVAYFFSWFSCFYDLFIILLLINRKTRFIGFILVFAFHFLTWLMFPIGVFPWVMIVGSLIFLAPELHQKLLRSVFGDKNSNHTQIPSTTSPGLGILPKIVLIGFICFQLLFPFRFLLNKGDLFWTESGYRFSWRVMLMEKAGYSTFYIQENEKSFEVDNRNFLTKAQEKQMATQPDMILQYANYLSEVYADTTMIINGLPFEFTSPEVNAEIYVSLNGRKSQEYVNSSVALTQIPNNFADRNWLSPFNK